MGDDNWDIGAIVKSCNVNRPNNVVDPNIGMETSENDDIHYLDSLLADDMNNFDGLSEIFSIDFPVAHLEKLDDQVIIMNQNDNHQLHLNPIQPAQFCQQISFSSSATYKSRMGDDNWDIGGVVRSFNVNRPYNFVDPNLGMETSENDDMHYLDSPLADDMNNFDGLSKILSIDFPTAHKKKSDDEVIIMNQNDNHQLHLHPIQPTQFCQQIYFPPSPTTIMCVPQTTATPQEWIDLQQQFQIGANIYPNINFSSRTPLIQTSIRKNQSTRMFHKLLPEELIDDTWTWNKYGQKHIKGSPFPRNYFKCTSISCEAKKTIEKSPMDQNIFLVSYSGEHNHNLPMKRRYFVGYNNCSKFKLPKGVNVVPRELSLNASSSSSKRAKRSRSDASPSSATMPMLEIESNNKMIVVAVENKGNGEEE